MFSTPGSRYALRSTLVGISGAVSSLASSAISGGLSPYQQAILALSSGLTLGLAYAGIGAVSKSVEPSVGSKS